MAGKGDKRRPGANDALYLKNNPFPSLLERRKARGISAAEAAAEAVRAAEEAEQAKERAADSRRRYEERRKAAEKAARRAKELRSDLRDWAEKEEATQSP